MIHFLATVLMSLDSGQAQGLTLQLRLDKQSFKSGEALSGDFLLVNAGQTSITIDRRLFTFGNVRFFVYDQRRKLAKYENYNLQVCGIPPQARNELIELAPGQMFGTKEVVSAVRGLRPGKYEVVGLYTEAFGFGESPLKGQFWEGQLRSNPVTIQIKDR